MNKRQCEGPSWDDYFFDLIPIIASKSKDLSTKVGAVIVGPNHEIRSTGYNSFPRGIKDDLPERQNRPEKYLWIEHAERNAVYNAARMGTSLEGCTIYISWYPCTDCARSIIQSGIKEIVIDNRDNNKWKHNDRWKENCGKSIQMLTEAGVYIRQYNPDA